MKRRDLVFLREDNPEYLAMGLKKEGTIGLVWSDEKIDGKWKVGFLDDKRIIGEEFWIPEEDLILRENPYEKKALSYDGETIPNYCLVELMKDIEDNEGRPILAGALGIVIEVYEGMGGFELDFSIGIENDELHYAATEGNNLRIIHDNVKERYGAYIRAERLRRGKSEKVIVNTEDMKIDKNKK